MSLSSRKHYNKIDVSVEGVFENLLVSSEASPRYLGYIKLSQDCISMTIRSTACSPDLTYIGICRPDTPHL